MYRNNLLQTKEKYNQVRNTVRLLIIYTHKASWDTFISGVELDLRGRQDIAYKLMRHLNREEIQLKRVLLHKKD